MTCPWIAAGEDSIQMWRVAQNIFNKQLCGQSSRAGPPAWGLGRGLATPYRIKPACYRALSLVLRIGTSCGFL